ncbi:MAG: type II toxin-antitoxin system VapC family toxin [Treponema phagedenis]|uniref:type II toxin-antitoxin system VapC family toxin n=1 Tax=Treponema phagedenis TaxID=162 RepID=UPI0031340A6C
MKYLLDTHTILWYLFGDARLPKTTKDIIEANPCFYSYASFWEIAIKQSKKKLEFTRTVYEIDEMCRQAGFIKLPITLDDFNRIRNLPFQENVRHNDPFDRILISQAIENDLTIITTDGNIPLYDVKTVW